MLPSIFNNNLFDDFFGFPFYYDNRAEDKAEKKPCRQSDEDRYQGTGQWL